MPVSRDAYSRTCLGWSLSRKMESSLPLQALNSKVVQERLGHSTISITLGVYGHVTLIDATRCHAEMR